MTVRNNKKIIVALSGGIDSSVAAALLKKAGFNPVGVFMKFWAEPRLREAKKSCFYPEAEKRARLVANKLGIPFYVFDFEKEFKKRIVDYFLESYKKGQTPNPCVVCNKEIKFGLLLEKALSLGMNSVATGHYARLSKNNKKSTLLRVTEDTNSKEKVKLLKAKDKQKDQSYFLWMLNQDQLRRVLFPVGDYTKEEVRNLSKKFRLPSFDIPESMEICFVRTTINDFLARYIKTKPGLIVNEKGEKVGRHQGLYFYTIGQRKGVSLSGGPYYVLDKDLKKNSLIVTRNEKDLYKRDLIARKINWISGKEPNFPLKVKAKIRFRQEPATAMVKPLRRSLKVVFRGGQRAVTLGQSVVFYRGNELLGGGIIS